MDIGRAFSFVFEDEEWIAAILIGALLLFIPLLGPILLTGFMLETARNVANNSPRPLPSWSNFGDKLSQGLAGFVLSIVYLLPVVLLGLLCSCVLIGALLSANGRPEQLIFLIITISLCGSPLILLLSLGLQPLLLVAYARYLQTGSLGAALRFGEVWRLFRADLGGWLVLFLLQILCGLVAGLGSAILVVGVVVTSAYAQAVFGHLLGQHLRQGPPAVEG